MVETNCITNGESKVYCGDCLLIIPTLEENSADSIVCDPPYGLKFMGKSWDHGVPGTEFWKAFLRVAKPGAHLLAFGGTRTHHRLMVAIEDAGWEIRDCIMWVYGSGFPKSMNVAKAIHSLETRGSCSMSDQRKGVMGDNYVPSKVVGCTRTGVERAMNCTSSSPPEISTDLTDAAKQWAGWGTALKPAYEPIIVARKPLEGTVAANVLKHGTGALNIDGCRIATEGEVIHVPQSDPAKRGGVVGTDLGISNAGVADFQAAQRAIAERTNTMGRWPANLIHDGSDEVLCVFPDSKGQQGDLKNHTKDRESPNGCFGKMSPANDHIARGDSGSAARFFYCAKCSKKDRGEGNNHPTVKPTSLMQYLCRLVTPPNGVVLDPFAGSCSTGKAALAEGFRFIGIELEQQNVDIGKGRLGW